jgi:F-type H+-transporting ATPase subunit delta
MSIKHDQATLTSYAQALLELADARGVTQQVNDDLQSLVGVINSDAAFGHYLSDPTVGQVQREAVLDRVLGNGQTPATLVSFIKVLNAKNRLGDLTGIASAFKGLLDVRAGNVDVSVTVAQQLSADELENVRHRVSVKLSKNAVVTQTIDESIIGGLILKVGDTLIDGSVKTQLETIKKRLIAAV